MTIEMNVPINALVFPVVARLVHPVLKTSGPGFDNPRNGRPPLRV
jgi:hypothetical protein